jgi:hypothetical protein
MHNPPHPGDISSLWFEQLGISVTQALGPGVSRMRYRAC